MSATANVIDLKGGKYKIAKEVAEAEFVRLCEANRIDHDTSDMTEKDLKAWDSLKDDIVRDLRLGTLIVGEDGKPTYTPPGASSGFTFHSPTGATLIAGRSKENEVENTIMALADMARVDRGTFSKLHARDFMSCSRIVRLFLADR
jgi:hypothetical protein